MNYIVSAFLPISHNHFYWFISCYLILMLLSPLINRGLQALSNQNILLIIGILVYINCITGWLFKNGINSNGFNTMQMIFMYVVGHGLHRFDTEKKGKLVYWLIAYVVLSVLNMLTSEYLPERFSGYNNPLVVLKSIVAFCIFLRIHFQSKIVNRIAACVFPCYLLQEGAAGLSFYDIQYQVWELLQNPLYYWCFANICVIGFFVLSMLLEPIRKLCMNQINDRLYTTLKLHRIDDILNNTTKL